MLWPRRMTATPRLLRVQADLGSTHDLADQLERLAALRGKGILTDEEFQAQKAKLLL